MKKRIIKRPRPSDGWTLGDDKRNRARQLRGQGDESRWAIADFLNDEFNAAPKRHRLSVLAILSSDAGLGKSTGRQYRRIAQVFPDGARDLFAEGVATWGHARVAVSAPDPIAALLWVVNSADERGGTPATVDQLAIHVKESKSKAPPTRRERVARLLERAHRDLVSAFNLAHSAPSQTDKGRAFAADIMRAAKETEALAARLARK